MSYKVKCDQYPLLDVRQDELMIYNPKAKLEVNTVGEASFTIYSNHPYYGELHMLKSVFEISDDIGVIFRGRMTSNTYDFDNGKAVDLEGAMAFFNDTIVRPFDFPGDWEEDGEYVQAAESGNVIAFFLGWLINQHNSQVAEFQRFKLGNVTVVDENNYIIRSNSSYASTWDTLKDKLFGSSLGGYLCIRYESDGNYIDYLSKFTQINAQKIEFGKNLLDLKNEINASDTYTAAIPLGAKIGEPDDIVQNRLTIEEIEDGDVTDDIVKSGDFVYSKSAVQSYGWIYAPTSDTTWDDVTDARNLLQKASAYMSSNGKMLTGTIEISAVDLHFSDQQIQSFRIYRKIDVSSEPHGLSEMPDLTKLDIDLLNPQNTRITIGESRKTLTQNIEGYSNKIESIEKNYELNKEMIASTKPLVVILSNESHTIATDSSGNGGDFTDCKTTLQVYSGTEDVTDQATYTVETSDGITGAWNMATHTYSVTALTEDNGYVDFVVSYNGTTVTKRFVVSKAKSGTDGEKGDPGEKGETGPSGTSVTISDKSVTYQLGTSGTTAPTGTWSANVPTPVQGKYLWTRTIVTYSDGTSTTSYSVSYIAVDGADGKDGTDGTNGADGTSVTIVSTVTSYQIGSSGTTAPTGTWSTSIPALTQGKYLWTRTVVTYSDGNSTTSYSISYIAVDGKAGTNGAAGVGIKSITEYYLASSSGSGVTTETSGWTTSVQTVMNSKRYLWNYEVVTLTDNSMMKTSPVIIGVYGNTGAAGSDGADGRGISSIAEYYAVSSSNTTAPTTWSTSVQTMTSANKYLWNYEKITYTDGTTSSTTPCVIGVYGDKGATGATGPAGKGVSSITNYYLASASSSGVTTTTSGWTTTVQTISTSKKYLWNYEVIAYTDNTTTTTTPVIIGTYGNTGNTGATGPAGNGISSITEYYAVSTSNSTAPTSWVTTVPTMTTTNKYLWNYEVITYTNGTTEETVKRVIGVYGNTGATGAAGRVYMLEASDTAIKKGANNVLSPASITFKGFYRDGNAATRTAYAGRFKIEESTDGTAFTAKYTSAANESSKAYTPSSSSVKVIRCTMYAAGGTTNALDTQSVVVLTDVDNLEVGGRNLIRESGNFAELGLWSGNGASAIEVADVEGNPCIHATGGSIRQNAIYQLEWNAEYTYHCYVKFSVAGSIQSVYPLHYWVYKSNSLTEISASNGAATSTVLNNNKNFNADEWVHIQLKIKTIAKPDDYEYVLFRPFFFGGVIGGGMEYWVRWIKLEKGNIPTDWTPAPEDTATDINNAVAIAEAAQNALDVSLDVIVGTQTAATGAWTGKAKFSELKDGQQIVYWLPYAGAGNATLNLTLSGGNTTGAKNCYYGGTTRLTTHYPAGSAIRLVYRKAAAINGSTYEGWWADANYDSGNTVDRTRYQQAIKCGTTAIVAGNIIVGTGGLYKHLKAGTAFDITYPILYAGSAIAASGTGTNNYITIPFTVTTTQSITLTAYKPVYIKGKLSGTMFTPVSTAPLTQAVPTTADGYHYILLGQAYSTTAMYLLPEHPIFMYHNGAFKSFEQIAAEAAAAAENAQKDIDNLQIGGRNLARKTSSEWSNWWTPKADTNNSRNTWCYAYLPKEKEIGDRFTISFDLEWTKFTAGTGGTFGSYFNGSVDSAWTISNFLLSGLMPATSELSAAGMKHIVKTQEIQNANQAAATIFEIGMRVDYSDGTGKFRIKNLKVEKGNRATDWSPAPEDVQNSIDSMTKTVFSASTPTDTSVLWIDTSQTPPVAKRYNPSTVSWEIVGDTTDIVQKIYSDLYSQINQTTENIMIQVGERTYLKDEIDQKVSEISTSYTQDKDEFLFKFNQLSSTLQELSESTEQTFNETVKYIRFIDGSIYIGVEGNPLVLKQTNDRISFLENGVEVAYISNRKMYITDLQVINSQMIGTFRWQVESNESLSLV